MDITSLMYVLFLMGGGAIYYCIPEGFRWKWLILLSFIFVYASSTFGALFILLTSGIVYFSARKIEKSSDAQEKKRILLMTMILCFSVLIVLKYVVALPIFEKHTVLLDGAQQSVQEFVRMYLFPVGISYYTLQIVSYLLDVYWERIQAEQDYLKVLLFTCYFPQLVQGPISKYSSLAPELFKQHPFEWKNLKYGVQLMLWGFFKKMVIADRIGVVVNNIFYSGVAPQGFEVVLGLFLYGFQLYGNFSGGIDVIRGASECLGIQMTENFKQPFFSKSVSEFWRRWHISLGRWMKDYVFYPFSISKAMNKAKKSLKKTIGRKNATKIVMAVANILVFALVGIWHGLGTNNLGWGLYYGLLLALGILLEDQCINWKKKLKINSSSQYWEIFSLVRTFIFVTLGWAFDCSTSASGAIKLIVNIISFKAPDFSVVNMTTVELIVWIAAIVILWYVDICHEKGRSLREELSKKNYWVQVFVWVVVIQMIACFGRIPDAGGFIYENF